MLLLGQVREHASTQDSRAHGCSLEYRGSRLHRSPVQVYLRQVDVDWSDPISQSIQNFRFISFDMEILGVVCYLNLRPKSTFISRLSILPGVVMVTCAWLGQGHLRLKIGYRKVKAEYSAELINTLGSLFPVFLFPYV